MDECDPRVSPALLLSCSGWSEWGGRLSDRLVATTRQENTGVTPWSHPGHTRQNKQALDQVISHLQPVQQYCSLLQCPLLSVRKRKFASFASAGLRNCEAVRRGSERWTDGRPDRDCSSQLRVNHLPLLSFPGLQFSLAEKAKYI